MSYSNGLLSDQSYQTANKYVQRGLPGIQTSLLKAVKEKRHVPS